MTHQTGVVIYAKDDPKRAATERFLATQIKNKLVRALNPNPASAYDRECLVQLVEALAAANGMVAPSFDTWFPNITLVLGRPTCREIGNNVCQEMGITYESTAEQLAKLRETAG